MYDQELIHCQRYYYVAQSGAYTSMAAVGLQYASTSVTAIVTFPVTMRTTPTLTASSGTNYFTFARNGGTDPFNSWSSDLMSPQSAFIYNSTEISGTAGQSGFLYSTVAGTYTAFSAEL